MPGMNKTLASLLIASCLLPSPVLAADAALPVAEQPVIAQVLPFPCDTRLNSDGVPMLKLRDLALSLGYEITWNGVTGTVELHREAASISVTVGSSLVQSNETEAQMEAVAAIINDHTYVPQSFLEQILSIPEATNTEEATTMATATGTSIDFSDLNRLITEMTARNQFAGTILIAKDDEILFEAAYGHADREQSIPMQIDTKLNLGSCNKSFTAVAICQLEQADKLSFNDPVEKFLPQFSEISEGKITIAHLLAHRSGLQNYLADPEYQARQSEIGTIKELLPYTLSPLLFEPGSSYSYSNSGFVVLGAIIEEVSGQDYYDYIDEHIYQPAGMKSSGSFDKTGTTPNLALGYAAPQPGAPLQTNEDTLPLRGSSAGGGYSTVGDMFNFIQALRQDTLLKDSFATLLPADHEGSYGYGIGLTDEAIGHTGGAPGINAYYGTYPEQGYSIVIMANLGNAALDLLREVRTYLDLPIPAFGISINGQALQTKVAPTYRTGEAFPYVPLLDICEAIGADVKFDGEEITLIYGEFKVQMTAESSTILVNGEESNTPSFTLKLVKDYPMIHPSFFRALKIGIMVSGDQMNIRTSD